MCRAGSEILSLGNAVGIEARWCRYDVWCRMWLKYMPGRLVWCLVKALWAECTSIRDGEGLMEAPEVDVAGGVAVRSNHVGKGRSKSGFSLE